MTKTIVSFVLGAAFGCVGTFYICKKYYEAKNEEDVESVKEAFRTRKKKETKQQEHDEEPKEKTQEKKAFTAYHNIAKSYASEGPDDVITEPYSIAPDEFGEFDEYDKITLFCYSDGVLADENNDIIDPAESPVGNDWEEAIGEWEEDCAYIRNEALKCDYEILVDHRAFSSVSKRHSSGKETS